MKIRLIMVGKTNMEWVESGIGTYVNRIGHYVNFSMSVIPDVRNASALSQDLLKAREGEAIMKTLNQGDFVVLLDERGKEMASKDLAAWMEDRMAHFPGNMVFVIGGAYGFSDDVYARSNGKLSLSKMTFSHQMVRVIFLEQLYRAFTIIKGEPYHHE